MGEKSVISLALQGCDGFRAEILVPESKECLGIPGNEEKGCGSPRTGRNTGLEL